MLQQLSVTSKPSKRNKGSFCMELHRQIASLNARASKRSLGISQEEGFQQSGEKVINWGDNKSIRLNEM